MNGKRSECIGILAAVLLGSSVLSVLACVGRSMIGGTCGNPQNGTCENGCLAISCPTSEVRCNGPTSAYYCDEVPYTATCNKIQGNKIEWWDGYGMYHCMCGGGTPAGTVNAACYKVTAEALGCS